MMLILSLFFPFLFLVAVMAELSLDGVLERTRKGKDGQPVASTWRVALRPEAEKEAGEALILSNAMKLNQTVDQMKQMLPEDFVYHEENSYTDMFPIAESKCEYAVCFMIVVSFPCCLISESGGNKMPGYVFLFDKSMQQLLKSCDLSGGVQQKMQSCSPQSAGFPAVV
jgi:hypothetical protein